jgi:hypothetical protein
MMRDFFQCFYRRTFWKVEFTTPTAFFSPQRISQDQKGKERREGGRKRGERIESRKTGQRRGRPAGRLVAPTRGEKGERGERRKEKGMRSGGG